MYFDVEDTVHDPDWLEYYRGWWQHIGNFGLKWTDSAGKTSKFAPVDYDSSIDPDPGTGFLSVI